MSFDLGDYVEVKTRIQEFKEKYPDGRLQSEVISTGFDGFVAVKGYAYRDESDERPGTGLAWEPVPGLTSYTKNSELQNAETSAWGRAIVAALIADASSGVASADELRSRAGEAPSSDGRQRPTQTNVCPACGSGVYDNRAENYGTKKPLWKCSNKACQGGARKQDGGNWPWASWDDDPFVKAEITRQDYDPGEYVPDEGLEAPF